MRAVIQRVSKASVSVANSIVGKIDQGFCILIGFSRDDDIHDIEYIVNKILKLRVFEDPEGKMNLCINDVQGQILLISQFTLYADARKGNRPSFTSAATYDDGERLYEYTKEKFKAASVLVKEGLYGADMSVEIHNNGPVTILLDSKKEF